MMTFYLFLLENCGTVGVSGSTVVRFAKTLGYKGFLQLEMKLKKRMCLLEVRK